MTKSEREKERKVQMIEYRLCPDTVQPKTLFF